jgi:hypothetical protein
MFDSGSVGHVAVLIGTSRRHVVMVLVPDRDGNDDFGAATERRHQPIRYGHGLHFPRHHATAGKRGESAARVNPPATGSGRDPARYAASRRGERLGHVHAELSAFECS